MRSNPRFKLGRVWFCFLIFFFFHVKASRPFVSYITTVWVNNVTFSIRTEDSSVTLAFVTLIEKDRGYEAGNQSLQGSAGNSSKMAEGSDDSACRTEILAHFQVREESVFSY